MIAKLLSQYSISYPKLQLPKRPLHCAKCISKAGRASRISPGHTARLTMIVMIHIPIQLRM